MLALREKLSLSVHDQPFPIEEGASSGAGEPIHAGTNDAGGASVWFYWTAPMSGPATFQAYPTGSPLNSYTNIILAAYTNLTPATNFSVTNLSVTNLAFVTNGTVLTTNLTVRITNSMTFDAVAGVTYLIAVDGGSFGFTPNQNVFDLSWTSTISTNAGQFQMGPVTDAASTYRG